MKDLLIKNINLFDGNKDSKLQKDVDILVVDGKIAKIAKKIKNEKNFKEVDGTGKYAIPGLINLHVHLPGSGKAPFKNSNNKKLAKLICENKILHPLGVMMGKKYATIELKSGVTSLRAVGGIGEFDTILRDKINSGKIVGPRIFAANSAIATPNGHMAGTVAVACATSIDEAVKRVGILKEQGVDLIKVMITGGVLDAKKKGEPGILKMEPEMVKAICDEAHKLGFQVAAHVESFAGQKVAIENGVDTIEHGSRLDEEEIKLFKDHGTAFVATLSPAIPLALFDEATSGCNDMVQYNSYFLTKEFLDGIKVALANGIPVGLGNDTGCPFVPHYNFYRELIYFQNITKTSNAFAIYSATLNNAKIIKKDDIIGSIEENKYADIVILDKNPLDDLNNLQNPFMVIKDGMIVKNLKIKKIPFVEENLDKIQNIDIMKALKEKFE